MGPARQPGGLLSPGLTRQIVGIHCSPELADGQGARRPSTRSDETANSRADDVWSAAPVVVSLAQVFNDREGVKHGVTAGRIREHKRGL